MNGKLSGVSLWHSELNSYMFHVTEIRLIGHETTIWFSTPRREGNTPPLSWALRSSQRTIQGRQKSHL